VPTEERTARLTILINSGKKAVFERLCADEDLTPSQVMRRMIRTSIEARLGRPWTPGEETPVGSGATVGRRVTRRRASRA
jgi:hypothetical protein